MFGNFDYYIWFTDGVVIRPCDYFIWTSEGVVFDNLDCIIFGLEGGRVW